MEVEKEHGMDFLNEAHRQQCIAELKALMERNRLRSEEENRRTEKNKLETKTLLQKCTSMESEISGQEMLFKKNTDNRRHLQSDTNEINTRLNKCKKSIDMFEEVARNAADETVRIRKANTAVLDVINDTKRNVIAQTEAFNLSDMMSELVAIDEKVKRNVLTKERIANRRLQLEQLTARADELEVKKLDSDRKLAAAKEQLEKKLAEKNNETNILRQEEAKFAELQNNLKEKRQRREKIENDDASIGRKLMLDDMKRQKAEMASKLAAAREKWMKMQEEEATESHHRAQERADAKATLDKLSATLLEKKNRISQLKEEIDKKERFKELRTAYDEKARNAKKREELRKQLAEKQNRKKIADENLAMIRENGEQSLQLATQCDSALVEEITRMMETKISLEKESVARNETLHLKEAEVASLSESINVKLQEFKRLQALAELEQIKIRENAEKEAEQRKREKVLAEERALAEQLEIERVLAEKRENERVIAEQRENEKVLAERRAQKEQMEQQQKTKEKEASKNRVKKLASKKKRDREEQRRKDHEARLERSLAERREQEEKEENEKRGRSRSDDRRRRSKDAFERSKTQRREEEEKEENQRCGRSRSDNKQCKAKNASKQQPEETRKEVEPKHSSKERKSTNTETPNPSTINELKRTKSNKKQAEVKKMTPATGNTRRQATPPDLDDSLYQVDSGEEDQSPLTTPEKETKDSESRVGEGTSVRRLSIGGNPAASAGTQQIPAAQTQKANSRAAAKASTAKAKEAIKNELKQKFASNKKQAAKKVTPVAKNSAQRRKKGPTPVAIDMDDSPKLAIVNERQSPLTSPEKETKGNTRQVSREVAAPNASKLVKENLDDSLYMNDSRDDDESMMLTPPFVKKNPESREIAGSDVRRSLGGGNTAASAGTKLVTAQTQKKTSAQDVATDAMKVNLDDSLYMDDTGELDESVLESPELAKKDTEGARRSSNGGNIAASAGKKPAPTQTQKGSLTQGTTKTSTAKDKKNLDDSLYMDETGELDESVFESPQLVKKDTEGVRRSSNGLNIAASAGKKQAPAQTQKGKLTRETAKTSAAKAKEEIKNQLKQTVRSNKQAAKKVTPVAKNSAKRDKKAPKTLPIDLDDSLMLSSGDEDQSPLTSPEKQSKGNTRQVPGEVAASIASKFTKEVLEDSLYMDDSGEEDQSMFESPKLVKEGKLSREAATNASKALNSVFDDSLFMDGTGELDESVESPKLIKEKSSAKTTGKSAQPAAIVPKDVGDAELDNDPFSLSSTDTVEPVKPTSQKSASSLLSFNPTEFVSSTPIHNTKKGGSRGRGVRGRGGRGRGGRK